MGKLPSSFYRRPDVVAISRELLGKVLCTRLGGAGVTGGVIVETEAYAGPEDRASHAYGNRRTARTETMFREGGVAYIYLCYGMHAMLNVVTHSAGVPHAILIRAIEPTRGIDVMLRRRRRKRLDHELASGPGRLAKALGIQVRYDGESLRGPRIWIEEGMGLVPASRIEAGPRVGVDYAGDHAARPWRFRLRDCPWTSRAK